MVVDVHTSLCHDFQPLHLSPLPQDSCKFFVDSCEEEEDMRNRQNKRHYKKDTRFLYDLYTLCYDFDETPEGLDTKRRCDREEIRRRLAMGPSIEEEEDKPNRRQRLHSRLHSGMNLQICFMNEAGSDSDDDSLSSIHTKSLPPGLEDGRPATLQVTSTKQLSEQPQSLTLQEQKTDENLNFFTRQTQLQTEARLALVQAKEMAHMQMDIERQKRKKSPIADKVSDVVKQKVGPQIAGARRLTRPLLTKLNVAHLQLIVNDLHSQIEALNEELVGLLMKRDDLHMEQDSMLVDIEDLSKYLAAKEQDVHSNRKSDCSPLLKPKMRLLRNLVRK